MYWSVASSKVTVFFSLYFFRSSPKKETISGMYIYANTRVLLLSVLKFCFTNVKVSITLSYKTQVKKFHN